jgi:acylphosphatase
MAGDVGCRAIFRGTVQGVGFRYTARGTARAFAVTGFVRNRGDGTVELVAEGTRAEILAFLNAIEAEMNHCIDGVDLTWQKAAGGFSGFSITH